VATSVLNRAGQGDPTTYQAVLTDLVAMLEARLGPDHQATLNALSQLANSGRDRGDQAGRAEAIQRVLAAYDRQGRVEDGLMAAQGLAMAQSEAGDTEGSLAGQVGPAEQRLGEAVAQARRGGDGETQPPRRFPRPASTALCGRHTRSSAGG
jgi:hypothetical protein